MRLREGIDITKSMVKSLNEEDEVATDNQYMEKLKSLMDQLSEEGTALEKDVLDDQYDEVDDYETPQDFLEHLCDLHIADGSVTSMIYYDDTLAFLEKHEDEINELLSELLKEVGGSFKDLFGDNYDDTDPMNIGTSNKNLFAWFGYEEIARNLAYKLNELGDFNANI
ncbi:MAG: hypothetical protein J6T15_04985 [Bacilli bacterium]|nr:hypothetical protein [Bacilli bacterium]